MCELHCSEFAEEGSSEQQDEGSSSLEEQEEEEQEATSRWRRSLDGWMQAHDLTMDSDCFVIKPADESHGAGVLLVNDYESLEDHAQLVFRQVSSSCLPSQLSNALWWSHVSQHTLCICLFQHQMG